MFLYTIIISHFGLLVKYLFTKLGKLYSGPRHYRLSLICLSAFKKETRLSAVLHPVLQHYNTTYIDKSRDNYSYCQFGYSLVMPAGSRSRTGNGFVTSGGKCSVANISHKISTISEEIPHLH